MFEAYRLWFQNSRFSKQTTSCEGTVRFRGSDLIHLFSPIHWYDLIRLRRRNGLGRPYQGLGKQIGFYSILTVLLATGVLAQGTDHSVSMYALKPDPQFPDAFENGAIQYVCSQKASDLQSFFAEAKAPMDPRLVFVMGDQTCHIWYESSVEGFRVAPEDWPISELYYDVHTTSFMAKRQLIVGDNLDIAKAILTKVSQSIGVSLGLRYRDALEFDWAFQASTFHFPGRNIELRDNESDLTTAWTQDYIKAGIFKGRAVLLLPRNLYEGKNSSAPENLTFLQSIPTDGVFRSKLSWDGGDLLFVQYPDDPARTIMLYGSASHLYWGRNISPLECEYILKREFSVDSAIDVSDTTSHVDYLVSFIPAHRLAMVATPIRGERSIVTDALKLYRDITYNKPSDLLETLSIAVEGYFEKLDSLKQRDISELINQLRQYTPQSASAETVTAEKKQRGLEDCLNSPFNCFTERLLKQYLDSHFDEVTEWAGHTMQTDIENGLPAVLLEIIESQIRTDRMTNTIRADYVANRLKEVGFTVIRVPRIGGDPEAVLRWSGISYANSLLIEDQLFTPAIGLGKSEEALTEKLRSDLPSSLTVLPVYARYSLIYNGGIHCISGIQRAPVPFLSNLRVGEGLLGD